MEVVWVILGIIAVLAIGGAIIGAVIGYVLRMRRDYGVGFFNLSLWLFVASLVFLLYSSFASYDPAQQAWINYAFIPIFFGLIGTALFLNIRKFAMVREGFDGWAFGHGAGLSAIQFVSVYLVVIAAVIYSIYKGRSKLSFFGDE